MAGFLLAGSLAEAGTPRGLAIGGAVALMIGALHLLYGAPRGETLLRGRRAKGLCVACGYDLTGNVSGVCPECGTGSRVGG